MATAGKTVGFKDKDYVDNEFIDIKSAPDEEYLKGDGTWSTAAEIVGSGFFLDTLGDVTLTSLADDDFLIYDTATSLWKNKDSSTVPASIGLGTTDSVDFGDLTLTGNLIVGGTRTIINTEVLGVVDPIITLQTAADGGPLTVDSNKDVGLGMQYFDGSAKTAFLGFDDSELKFTFVPDATITNEVVTGTTGTIVADLEGTITAQGDTELYALSQVTSAADKGIQFTGSGTAATYDLTIAGKALLDDADAATQRLTLGLGSVATHSLSSVIAMTASQVPGYLQHLDPASISILKSGLGTIATHSLSSVVSMMSSTTSIGGMKDIDITSVSTNDIIVYDGTRWVNQTAPTARLSLGLGSIATHSLSSVLAIASGSASASYDPATKNILKAGLGTIATHSLSSVLGLIGEPRLPNYISPTTERILRQGLGTIATKSFASVLSSFDHNTALKGLQDTIIDSATLADNDFLIFNSSDSKWYNRSAATARLSLGLGSVATHSLSTVLAMTQASGAAAKAAAATLAYLLLEAGGGLGGQKLENEADTDDTNFIILPNPADDFSEFPLTSQSIGVSVQAYDSTIVVDADIGVSVQAYDATILVDADIGSTVQAYDATTPVGSSILVDADIGSTVQAYDATILVDADIGSTVQAYDATIVVDADIGSTVQAYDATIVVDADIGVSVQAYDATTPVGSSILVDADIGSTVQAYDSTIVVDADIGVSVQAYDSTIVVDADIGSTVFAQPSATGSLPLPVGTTAQQAGSQGGIRYNTTTPGFEGYDGSAWGALGGSTGGATSHIISEVDTGTVDLDGTYTETIMIADVFNVAGTVVLTADFYMSKISDDGTNVTLTGSGSITGSGTIGQAFPFFTGTAAEQRTQLGLGTIATHSLSTVLAMASGSASKAVTDFVSKASGGTFLGDIFATNLSGTNTGDQTLPTDFVSAANGGTFSDKVMISKVSAGFTADSHFKLENLGDVDQDRTGILWRTRSANGGKAWFGFEKMLNYGRGDFVWMLDNAQDDNTVTTTDEMLRLRHLTGSLEPGVDNTQNLGSGSKRWATMYGTATSANWSDLAERYEADKYYDEGTVLAIGGEKEVTEYVKGSGGHEKEMRMPFAGVVSIHPGLRMNDKLEYEDNPNFPYICLKGRIPVKINGTAKKGDYIIADDKGRGKSIGKQPNVSVIHDLIGIALSNSNTGFVEVKI